MAQATSWLQAFIPASMTMAALLAIVMMKSALLSSS
jgi:hypothetical protein